MLFHNNLFDFDDLEDLFEDWFRFGRKPKKVAKKAKKGIKVGLGCLTLLFTGTLLLVICGAVTLFAANRLFQPDVGTGVQSREAIVNEPVEDSQITDQTGEPAVEPGEAIEPELVEGSQITGQSGEATTELLEAIFIELVEDSRVIDQIGDPLQPAASDLTTTIRRSVSRSDETRLDFEGAVYGSSGSAVLTGKAAQVGDEVTFTELFVVTQSENMIDLLIEVGR